MGWLLPPTLHCAKLLHLPPPPHLDCAEVGCPLTFPSELCQRQNKGGGMCSAARRGTCLLGWQDIPLLHRLLIKEANPTQLLQCSHGNCYFAFWYEPAESAIDKDLLICSLPERNKVFHRAHMAAVARNPEEWSTAKWSCNSWCL